MLKPLPSQLVLAKYARDRWDAGRQVAYLRQAATRFPNLNVLLHATQRREIQSMLAFRGLIKPERSLEAMDLPAAGSHGRLPEVTRYVQVMAEAMEEVRTAPVGYVLRRVVHGLAGAPLDARGRPRGLPEGPVTNDMLPWRTARRKIGQPGGRAGAAAPPLGPKLHDETEGLLEWMDTPHEQLDPLGEITLGAYELGRLAPFANNADLVAIYITLRLVKSRELQGQILPVAVHLAQNQARYDKVQREAEETGDFDNLAKFLADGLAEQARDQLALIEDLAKLPGQYDETYRDNSKPTQRRDGFPHMLTVLPKFQVVTSKLIAIECGFSMKSAREYLAKAEKFEFIRYVETRRHTKFFEVVGVRHAIERYAGKARHRNQLHRPTHPVIGDQDTPEP